METLDSAFEAGCTVQTQRMTSMRVRLTALHEAVFRAAESQQFDAIRQLRIACAEIESNIITQCYTFVRV